MLENLKRCELCPHNCKVNRLNGEIGRCKCIIIQDRKCCIKDEQYKGDGTSGPFAPSGRTDPADYDSGSHQKTEQELYIKRSRQIPGKKDIAEKEGLSGNHSKETEYGHAAAGCGSIRMLFVHKIPPVVREFPVVLLHSV